MTHTPAPRPDLPDLGPDALLLADAAWQAGQIAMAFYGRDPRVWMKAGDSPVTEADLAADRYLAATLSAARPDHGWLSEETTDTAARLGSRRLFIVDPIDGTRGFIRRDGEWCVSVAIVEDGQPVAGALARPTTGEIYLAARGRGAWLGKTRLRVTAGEDIAAARFGGSPRIFASLGLAKAGIKPVINLSSLALRLAYVAAGALDCAIARENAHDWDLAAADLLVHEAGGLLTTVRGDRLVYNAAAPRHPALLAAGPGLHATMLRTLANA